VEAWHFQLTRETRTIAPRPLDVAREPVRGTRGNVPAEVVFQEFADFSGRAVIFDPAEIPDARFHSYTIFDYMLAEQRFPRAAFVVVGYPPPPPFPSPGILLPPLLEEPVKLETR
jgi:hypothetical protein